MGPALDDASFRRLSDECLAAHARWAADFDPDELDYAESDGVLTLEFADGARFVLNRQAGSRQMWFAAAARAWHYDWNAERGAWLDDKDGHELFARVAEVVGTKVGRKVAAL